MADEPRPPGGVIEARTSGRRWNDYRVTFKDGDAVKVESKTFVSCKFTWRTVWRAGSSKQPSTATCCAIRAALNKYAAGVGAPSAEAQPARNGGPA